MASAAEILVLIKGRDEASKVFQGVAKSAGGLGKVLTDVGKIAGGVVLGGALLKAPGAIKGVIDKASDLNETLSKSNTVFKGSAKEIEDWASTAGKSFGQSKKQALDAASTFGNMFSQLGIGSDAAADMSKSMTELGSDFASFHNADITEVLQAQTAAFRGEYDAVQRYVPTINAAAVEQKALAMGLAETTVNSNAVTAANVKLRDAQQKYNEAVKEHGRSSLEAQKAQVAVASAQDAVAKATKGTTSELTAQDKALATYQLLLEGAGEAMGDFDRTSDGLANRQRILAARFDDLQASLGQRLLPAAVAVAGFFLDKAIPAAEDAAEAYGPELTSAINSAAQFLQENRGTIEGVLSAFALGAQTAGGAIKDFGGWIIDNQGRIVGAVTAIGLAFAIFNPGAAVLVGLAAGVTAVGLFKTSIEDLNTPLLNMRLKLTEMAISMAEVADTATTLGFNHLGLKGPLEGTIDSLERERDAIRDELQLRSQQEQRLAAEAEGRRIATEAGIPYLEYQRNLIQAYVDALGPGAAMDEQLRRMIQSYTDAGGAASDLDGIVGGLKSTVETAAGTMDARTLHPIGGNLIQGLIDGINAKVPELSRTIHNVGGQMTAQFEHDFEIRSPSKVMHREGEYLMLGLANGITSGSAAYVGPAMSRVADFVESQAFDPRRYEGHGSANMPASYAAGSGSRPVGVGPSSGGAGISSSGGSRNTNTMTPTVQTPTVQSPKIMSYGTGTPYVPQDGLAYLHRGEAVIPARENGGAPSVVLNVQGAIHSDRDLVRIIREAWLNGAFRGMPATS